MIVSKSKNSSKKYEKIEPALQKQEVEAFLSRGDWCLGAAQLLFRANAYFMFPAAVLCAHGIELLLKACQIWVNCEFSKTHKLVDVADNISFLKLTKQYKDILVKIDTFYSFRYPLNNESSQWMARKLEEIKDEIHGIPTLPGEVGTEDWLKVRQFRDFLIESMPDELYSLCMTIGTTLEK